MGVALLECVSGCSCAPQRIDAHKTSEIRNTSVYESHTFTARRGGGDGVGPAREWCEVVLTLLAETSSGRHKFKVRSLTVTSELPSSSTAAGGPRETESG